MNAVCGPLFGVVAIVVPVVTGLLLLGKVTPEGIDFASPVAPIAALSGGAIFNLYPAPLAQTVLVHRHPFELELRDLRNGRLIRELEFDGPNFLCACQSADGSVIAAANLNGIGYVRAQDDSLADSLGESFPEVPPTSLALSSDGALCCSGHDDTTVRLWETKGGTLMRELRTESGAGAIRAVQFTSDDRCLITADGSGSAFLWDLETGGTVQRLTGSDRAIRALAASADGMRLVAGSTTGTVSLWNLETRTRLWSVRFKRDAVLDVAITPDGQSMFAACQKSIYSLDARSGRTVATMNGHTGSVNSLAVAAGGRKLLSGSADGTLRIWDVASGQELSQVR